jgi:small subunit ribosomal protein S16
MSVVIRLMRAGAKKRPFFRLVAADSRRQRDGRFLEILGHYNPVAQPYELVVHKDKIETWLKAGAQPSEQCAALLHSLGMSWQAPSKPTKTEARRAVATTKGRARRVKKTLSARKVKARATRARLKANPRPKVAKKKD